MIVWHQLGAFVRRDYLLANASPFSLVWPFVAVLFAAPTLYYLARLVPPVGAADLGPYGGDYFGFVIIGIAFSGFFAGMMGGWGAGLRNEQLRGTLEAVLVHPVAVVTAAAGSALWVLLVGALHTLAYLVLAVAVFRLRLPHANLGGALTAIAFTGVVYTALGMISAALALTLKTADPLTGIVAAVSVLAAGVFYPVTLLPAPLQGASQWLPLTHTLQAVRLALLSGAGIAALGEELATLLLFGVVTLPLACAGLIGAVMLAKRQGTLRGR